MSWRTRFEPPDLEVIDQAITAYGSHGPASPEERAIARLVILLIGATWRDQMGNEELDLLIQCISPGPKSPMMQLVAHLAGILDQRPDNE